MIVAVSLMSAPIPEHEAEENAANNYLWPQAVETTKMHQAHLLVAVLGKKASLIERGKLFVKVIAACCRQPVSAGGLHQRHCLPAAVLSGFGSADERK